MSPKLLFIPCSWDLYCVSRVVTASSMTMTTPTPEIRVGPVMSPFTRIDAMLIPDDDCFELRDDITVFNPDDFPT